MKYCLSFGKFSKFYLLIIYSYLVKLLINILFRIEYQDPLEKKISNCSIIKYPVLNKHILIYFIYYYFGYLVLSLIFLGNNYRKEKNQIDYIKDIDDSLEINSISSKSLKTKRTQSLTNTNKNSKFFSFFFPNLSKMKINESLYIIFLICFIYMISEMIINYLNQKNYIYIDFCIFQIIFIHFFLFIKEKNKLYRHQILSFCLILILGFGIKLIFSLTKQCEYPIKDPNKDILDFWPDEYKEIIRNAVISTNEKGVKSCKNAYNIFFDKTGDFYGFIIIAILGYLIGNILQSFSTVKIRDLINKKYFSHYSLIFFIGCFGLIISIIVLTLTSLISCGKNHPKNNDRISFLCPAVKNIIHNTTETTLDSEYFFDNLISYIADLNDAYIIKQKGKDAKKKKDVILEIIFTVLLPLLTFSKVNFDFLIIKELSPFHILFPEILFQISRDFITIIYKIYKGLIDNTQIKQFIFITVANLIISIGLFIYLELIEIKCCKFDKDIKKNIAIRSINDVDTNEGLVDNEIYFGDDKYGINERDSYTGNEK